MRSDRVAVITAHAPGAKGYGGVVEVTASLARAWIRLGRSFLICASDASRDARVIAADAVAELGTEVTLYRALWFKRWGFGPGALWRVPKAVWRADTVHISGTANWPVTIGAIAAWLLRRPYAVSPHGGLMAVHVDEIRRTKPHKWLYYRFLTLPLLRRARTIHVTSEIERNGVLALLPKANTVLISNGVDLERWRPAPPLHCGRDRTLCFVGRVSPEKGINAFVKTWLRVRGPGDRLIVVGDGRGSYAEQLRALASQAGAAFELLGYVDQARVHAALTRSHFLILPSVRENFGNVVAEALAAGRPVLVARGLAWDFVESEGIGFVFDRTEASVRAVLDRIRSIPADDYRAMCERARRYAEAHFDLGATSRRLWDVVTQSDLEARTATGLAI